MHLWIYSSSLTGSGSEAAFPVVPSKGQHKAGDVALKRYSHFSGSVMESKAFVTPQDSSTVAEREGPFQHLALSSYQYHLQS